MGSSPRYGPGRRTDHRDYFDDQTATDEDARQDPAGEHTQSLLGGSGNLVGWATSDQPPGIGWSALVRRTSDGHYRVVNCKAKTITHA